MDSEAFARMIEPYRRELRAHCYRMSGSILDADDLLQESLLRAWKGMASFEGRSSLRTWLYSVTTHACLDALEKKSARQLPGGEPNRPLTAPQNEPIWLEPAPSDLDPESSYDRRESIALAFLVALQQLPPRQRAVLILREVLGWQASECAELLDMSVAAVNSALQRARETLDQQRQTKRPRLGSDEAGLLERYVRAWETRDVAELVSLLHRDATLAMPPYAEWLQGAEIIGGAIEQMVFAEGPHFRCVAISANGLPGFAVYRDGQASAIHVLEIVEGKIVAITAFLEPRLLAAFGLPTSVA